MKAVGLMVVVLMGVTGCISRPRSTYAPSRVVVVDNGRPNSPRAAGRIPPGHYPRAGECRIWFLGRPPGQQPRPVRCESLIGHVPRGSFLLYDGKAWDTMYDWRGHVRRHPGSVPQLVVRVTTEAEAPPKGKAKKGNRG